MTRKLYSDDLAERLKEDAGNPWRPSNGTEGDVFMAHWCEECQRYKDDALDCELGIVSRAMFHEPGDAEYPAEWQYGADGQPRCTAFTPSKENP